jgi:hypothetical protein
MRGGRSRERQRQRQRERTIVGIREIALVAVARVIQMSGDQLISMTDQIIRWEASAEPLEGEGDRSRDRERDREGER